jgi:predicted Zn-dependent peptidase
MRALSVTDENFQNQLSVVKEERKQRYDNRPYGLSYLTMLEMLFGGSQYGWGPIGDMAHLDAAPLETVREFHRRYYTPGNATLVVCGDFEPEEARRLVEEQFGDIPAGEPVPRPPVQVKQLGQQVRRTIRARVPLPSVYVGFQSAPITHRDAPALGVLSIVLDRGRSSRLNRSLVYGSQSAQDAQAFNLELEHAGMFLVQGTAAEGVPVERVEEEIWTQLELIRESGIEERELRAVQNYIETILVTSLWRLSGVADMLARYHVLCGDASRINSLLDEYRAVTVEDVRRVANLYLRPDAAAVLHYLPEELSAS